jgi:hypothetical protein
VSTVNARPRAYLQPQDDDFVTHLAAGSRPVLISFEMKDGRVIICTAPFPLTNAGLKKEGNPELVLNLVTAARRPDASDGRPVIWFDEWHHGVRSKSATAIGPAGWLRHTPSGHAMLYTATVIVLALALGGRRFGRPVPLHKRTVRRPPLEYVTAIANLNRRAGHRRAVLSYHYQQLKRGLGKRYRLSPTLPDSEYVARLAEFDPDIDTQALSGLLARLRQKRVTENEMVQLAAKVAAWLKE